jgi:hypothetical protein
MTDFYDTYPLAYFSVFATASIDKVVWQSVLSQIKPNISNRSQEDAVNWLLHFVQNAFAYKTDQDNYGYEKWSFAKAPFVKLAMYIKQRNEIFTVCPEKTPQPI